MRWRIAFDDEVCVCVYTYTSSRYPKYSRNERVAWGKDDGKIVGPDDSRFRFIVQDERNKYAGRRPRSET